MYNLLEASESYSMVSGSLWNYYRDGMNDDANENNTNISITDNSNTVTNKSFEYKAKIIENTPVHSNTFDTKVVVPLRYLVIFKDLSICL